MRESALDCIVTMIQAMGLAVKQTVLRLNVRPSHMREIDSRLSAAEPLQQEPEQEAPRRSPDTSPAKVLFSPFIFSPNTPRQYTCIHLRISLFYLCVS